MEQRLMTVKEAAEMLHLSLSHTYQLIQEGAVPAVRLGTAIRVPRARVEAMIQDAEEAAVSGSGGAQ